MRITHFSWRLSVKPAYVSLMLSATPAAANIAAAMAASFQIAPPYAFSWQPT
jgi:hypothetical protein